MSRRNKILVVAIVGILTVGIAFGALNIASAHNEGRVRNVARPQQEQRLMQGAEGKNGTMHEGRGMMLGHERADNLAKFLGISSGTLGSERESGKSLLEIATEHGKTSDELKAFLTKEFTDRADTLLKDGKITQEQYDYMKSGFDERIGEMINRTDMGMPEWAGISRNEGKSGTGRKGFNSGHCGEVNNP